MGLGGFFYRRTQPLADQVLVHHSCAADEACLSQHNFYGCLGRGDGLGDAVSHSIWGKRERLGWITADDLVRHSVNILQVQAFVRVVSRWLSEIACGWVKVSCIKRCAYLWQELS